MANSKISALTAATTPVAGTEILPIVQSSATVKLAISDLNPGLSTITAAKGGTGQTSYAVGDLLYANTTTTLAKLADVATGTALISGGVGVAPSYGKIGLTTHVSGTLPVANGGTNLTSFTANGVVYASSTSALTTGTAITFDGTNLLIGTTTAVSKLTVSGTVVAGGYGTGYSISTRIGQSGDGASNAQVDMRRWTGGGTNHGTGRIATNDSATMLFYTDAKTTDTFATTEQLQITSGGNVLVTGTGTGSLGYGAGAGGTVTQATSRTTGVTLSKPTGAITMFSAAGSVVAATFTVTNSLVAATDTIILNQKSGTNLYVLLVTAVAASSFNITFYTTGGVATDAPVINFSLIKGVTA